MRVFSILALSFFGQLLFGCSTSIVVNSSANSGSGTLRQAVTNACPQGVITFSLPINTVITLVSGPITIANSVAINGPSPLQLTISGGGNQQIFIVSGNPVVIRSLILKDGLAQGLGVYGGAVDNSGTLTLQNVLFGGDSGDAVYNGTGATLTADHCTFRGNISPSSTSAIENQGTARITSSQFESNQAPQFATVTNDPGGTLEVTDSTFSNNSGFIGGAIANGAFEYPPANASVSRCTFKGNSAVTGSALSNGSGTMTISRSIVSENSGGVAVYNFIGCFLTIEYSTIDSNGLGNIGSGGVSTQGSLSVSYSAITRNQTAITDEDGSLNIFRCTISGNMLGVYNGSGSNPTTIAFSTITSNSGGGLLNTGLNTTLNGVILAGNTFDNCFGDPIVSTGYNISDDSSCNFTQPTDLQNTNPVLGALANNGGPTQTQALLPGSPAIDTGGLTGCSPTDQRGVPAPQNVYCDRGAYELIQ